MAVDFPAIGDFKAVVGEELVVRLELRRAPDHHIRMEDGGVVPGELARGRDEIPGEIAAVAFVAGSRIDVRLRIGALHRAVGRVRAFELPAQVEEAVRA